MLGQAGPVLLGLGSIARNGGFKGDNLKTYGGPCDPRHLLTPGEIYVSLKDVTQSADLLGAVARVPSHIPLGRLTQDTVKLVFKQEDAPKTYLYWLLQTPQYREYCRAHSTGTTNLGLAREDFLNFEVPPLNRERQWIVDLVQNIEDKIELNRRMSETLEGMAQAIFRDWFVDFGPTRRKAAGEADPVAIMGGLTPDPARAVQLAALFPAAFGNDGLPVGWSRRTVESIMELAYGKSLPKTVRQDGPFPVYGSGGVSGTHSTALVSGPGIIVGRKGTVGSLYWEAGDFFAIDTVFYVVPKAGVSLNFAWHLLQTLGLENMNTDAAVPGLNRGNAYRLEFAFGSQQLLDEFEAFAGPLRARQDASNAETQTLAETRDYLLPRLMSGAVRVASKVEAA
jgi:type I restriction enzyme S subunit